MTLFSRIQREWNRRLVVGEGIAYILSIVAVVLVVLALVAAMVAIPIWCFKTIWNWALVSLFNLPVLTFWQAAAILAIFSIIGNFFRSNTKTNS
jgi:hypothetical protein